MLKRTKFELVSCFVVVKVNDKVTCTTNLDALFSDRFTIELDHF